MLAMQDLGLVEEEVARAREEGDVCRVAQCVMLLHKRSNYSVQILVTERITLLDLLRSTRRRMCGGLSGVELARILVLARFFSPTECTVTLEDMRVLQGTLNYCLRSENYHMLAELCQKCGELDVSVQIRLPYSECSRATPSAVEFGRRSLARRVHEA